MNVTLRRLPGGLSLRVVPLVALELRRIYRGKTGWGIYTNLFDARDRIVCGGWYCNAHLGRVYVECYRCHS